MTTQAMAPPRILVTRPQAQADVWARALCAAGLQADALPLIDIAPTNRPQNVWQIWSSLDRHAMVVFVSPNAVAHFFALKLAGKAWPEGIAAACTGPGTASALREHGVPDACIVQPPEDAAQFDTETLWATRLAARDWAGRSVLVVRGDGGRAWLADTLRSHGASVRFVPSYRRTVPALDDAQQQLLDGALARPGDFVWLFSSSQAIDHLEQLAPAGIEWSAARALATHPRIAERAAELGIGDVRQCRPMEDSVVHAIQSWGDASIESRQL